MPAQATPKPTPAKRRGWLRRFARWALWALLVLVVFHRPLVHFAGRRVAIWLAAREHLVLDFHIAGNLWSHIELRDVAMRADGAGPTPIERLKLDRLALDYSLWKAIRTDWPQVLRRAEIGVLDGVIVLQPPEKDSGPKTPVAKAFGDLISKSLSPVEHLSVGRVDLKVKDVAAINGLHMGVRRGEPGEIGWEKIHVAGLPDIGAASAELVMNESVVAISKLPLFPQIVVRRLSLNHVTPTLPRGGLEFLAELGGGTAGLRVEPSVTQDALDVVVDVKAVRLNEVAAPFGVELPVPAEIENFHVAFTGKPEDLASSVADAGFAFRMSEKGSFPSAIVRGEAKLSRGVFRISELSAVSSGIELRIGGELNVPLSDFAPAKLGGEITWKLAAPDLAALRLGGLTDLRGAVSGSGSLRLAGGEAHTVGDIAVTQISQGRVRTDSAVFHLDARRKITSLDDFITGLLANVSFDVKGVTVDSIRVDAISAKGKLDGQRVTIEQFSATSGENTVTGTARATLKPGGAGFADAPEMELHIVAPRLEQFGIVVNGSAFAGTLMADGNLRLERGQLVGGLQAKGDGMRLGDARLSYFSAGIRVADGVATGEVNAGYNAGVQVAAGIVATGTVRLDGAMPYSGEISLNIHNLADLDVLAGILGHPAKLGGSLGLGWSGTGEIAGAQHSGKFSLTVDALRHDAVRISEIRLGGTYSPGSVETTEFRIVADHARVGARVAWKNGRLDVSDILVRNAGADVLQGHASVPLDPLNAAGPIPPGEPLDAQFAGKDADIAGLLSSFGIAAPVSGKISADLTVGGTLSKPEMKLGVAARSLKSATAASLAPADVDLKMTVADARLTLDAVAKQRDIQPITVSASLPLDLNRLRAQPALAADLPVKAAVKLPASSLAFVAGLVPAIARLDGTVAANVEVHGTVAKPVVNGEVTIATKSVRLASAALPPISNFASKIIFSGDTITLDGTRGEIGGGSFKVDGGINVATLTQPAFDLRLRSDKVLVLRDEAVTVRADADVTVRGPLNAATAAGTVFVTQGRFYKDVDILPLSLPGKMKPQARSVATPMRISFPNPPLRDWKFDIAIKTREKDSFLIRGNLAKGSSALDLRLGGTGLEPFLAGNVQIESFTAILPASKLVVKRGTVTFSQDDPFQPYLDLQAESRIGKNTVTAYISGPANSPRLDLDSEPPLPQRDILALLATGTTTGELGSNAGALATRAALLKVKQWYRKTFRKGADEPAADGQESFADRFEVDIGNVDPKTGRPDVEASVRITDRVYFLGEIGLEGQFTGKVKYLLRFR